MSPAMSLSVKFFNDFKRKFRELEQRCTNDVTQIESLVKNSEETRRLVGSLYFWEHKFESERGKRRFLQNIPSWFIDLYSSYKQCFGPEVQRVYGRLSLLALVNDVVDGIPATEIFHLDGPPTPNEHDTSEVSGWFVPGDGAEAVDSMIDWLWNMYDLSDHAEDLKTGLDAWEWFTETVGLDLVDIEGRWNKLPRAMLPSHFDRGPTVNSSDSLTELLDDATGAYVFGFPAAAIAMCRAVCEKVLKEFYFYDSKPSNRLGDLAKLAEKRYDHVKKMELRRHIDLANQVMHEYHSGQLSEDKLNVIQEFLEVAKGLIEQAPPPPL